VQSNLAWKLALVLKGFASPELLTSYNVERLPVIAQMLHATTALYTHTVIEKNFDAPEKEKTENEKATGWYRWRNTALEMYGINYRYSDLVLEQRDTKPRDQTDALARAYAGYEGLGTLCAGDRAPEASGLVIDGKDTSLFKLLTLSKHTVLIFTDFANVGDIRKALDSSSKYPEVVVQTMIVTGKEVGDFGGATIVVDRDSNARSTYLVEEGLMTVVIVRPDGFIGAILYDTDGIDGYFGKIFKISV